MTVKELIEYLQQCPETYQVIVETMDGDILGLYSIDIDHTTTDVSLKTC